MSALLAYVLSNKSNVATLLGSEKGRLFWLLLLVVVLLATAAFCSVRVIVPRLFTSHAKGLIFFGTVSNHAKAQDYVDVIARADEATLTNARLAHCYDLSKVCTRKYQWLRAALWIGIAAVAAMAVVLIWMPH